MLLILRRQQETTNGVLGVLTIDSDPFHCFTVENKERRIAADTYAMNFTWSKRFQRIMPHIIVPYRDVLAGGDAGIRIHTANFPTSVEGCVGVGLTQGTNAVYDSKAAFERLYKIIRRQKELKIQVGWDI